MKQNIKPSFRITYINYWRGRVLKEPNELLHRESVKRTMERCQSTVSAMYAEVPDDLSSLADVHSVINGSQLESRHPAWSWADYKKESACDSQLRFIEPQVALDRSGQWKVVVQSEGFLQRVAIDTCRHVNDVCKVWYLKHSFAALWCFSIHHRPGQDSGLNHSVGN